MVSWGQRIKDAGLATIAKGFLKGVVMQHVADWTLEDVKTLLEQGRGILDVLPQEVKEILPEQARKWPQMRILSAQDFLEWVKAGNPGLFAEMASSPGIMDWLVQGWEAEILRLFGPKNGLT